MIEHTPENVERMLAIREQVLEAIDFLAEEGMVHVAEPIDFLQMTCLQFDTVIRHGVAAAYLKDQLPEWDPYPDKILGDVLKRQPPVRLAHLADVVKQICGLDIIGTADIAEVDP